MLMAFHTTNFSFEGIASSGCLYSSAHVFVKTSGLKNTPLVCLGVEWSYNYMVIQTIMLVF